MLSDIQVECKDANMRYHMYECLIALADVQKHMFHIFADVTTFESLWSVIWESTLRYGSAQIDFKRFKKLYFQSGWIEPK